MTVRVNKSAFNIREKLSELAVKFGLKGTELARAETVQDARDLISAGRKNLIINGDMNINQRGTNITDISDGDFVVDRHLLYSASVNSATFDVSLSTQAPIGFTRSLKFEVDSAAALSTAGYVGLEHVIEGFNTAHLSYGSANAKTITASFWCRSSEPGTFAYTIRNSAFDRTYIKEFTINNADTWEYKTLTFPGCTDGTWLTTNGVGQRHTIIIDGGTDFLGTPNIWNTSNLFVTSGMSNTWADTSGNTFYITGWQVEVGKNATEFEHRSYGEELALCQRYYYKLAAYENYTRWATGWAISSTQATFLIKFPVTMRANPADPTLVGTVQASDGNNALPSTSVVNVGSTKGIDGASVRITTASGLVQFRPYYLESSNGTGNSIAFSAEL